MIETHVLTGTTDGSGDSTATTERPVIGEVLYVEVDGAALTDSANLVLQPVVTKLAGSTELGESIINHTDIGNATIDRLYPRRFAQDNAGADLTVATSTKVAVPYFVPGVYLRATVSAGGATKDWRVKVFVRRD